VHTIQIADFASAGVTLTSAAHADFDARAQAILGDQAAILLEAKPFLALVRNDNPRTVVAYTVAWTATQSNGTSEVDYTQFQYPDAVAGTVNGLSQLQGREVRTGDERLVGMGFEAWPPDYAQNYLHYALQKAVRLRDIRDLHIALDAVIFEDGTMLGPDEWRLGEHFIEFVHAKQSLYRDIVLGLEESSVKQDALSPLREILAAPQRNDRMSAYRRQAASEALSFHDRVMHEVFVRTLRREPFVIRKLSGTSD
jgi:hypothetical protein